jgi:hypothetical protein
MKSYLLHTTNFTRKKSTRDRQNAAENAKINRIILEQAGEAGRKRTN